MYRFVSFILAITVVFGLLPKVQLSTSAAETAVTLEGKKVSILGDSISTYAGVSNNTSYNSTIGKNSVYYTAGRYDVYQADTWWQQTIDVLGMELLVNNSWSGSCVLNTRSGTVGAYMERCVQLHNDSTGEDPDIILVFLGTNDFSYYKDTWGTCEIDYQALIADNGDGTFTYGKPATTCEAYAIMLHKMTIRYPDAEIYCMNLLARRDPDYAGDNKDDVGQPTEYNQELAAVIDYFGCGVVDMENCGISKDSDTFDLYMGDYRVHPNKLGMDAMTQCVVSALLGKETTVFDISLDLSNVTLAGSEQHAILAGDEYTVTLAAEEGYRDPEISVTMGGEDISLADGVISIPAVTGDVLIKAFAAIDKEPADYCWEFDGTGLVSTGSDDNTLTLLGGSVSDGLLVNTYYSLTEQVILRHDLPWVVEFKASGSWSGMLLSAQQSASTTGNIYLFKTTSTTGFIGFGERKNSQYQNYGVALDAQGVDTTLEHTYRLENRISEDGTNMVYLMVDDVDYGSMNHYFIGGSNDQGTTVDWLSGKDLAFSYIGANGHALNNCAIDYIQINECVHSYKSGICTACGSKHPNLANYEGKVISILGDSISTYAGYIPTADGFNLEHLARYPQDNLLTDVNETWWMQVITELDAKLGINDSWRGATVSGAVPVTTGTTGENAAMGNLTRIQNLGSNGTPDVILFYGGTNDLAHVSKVGTFDASAAPTALDLTTTKWDNLADAYVQTLLRLKYYYPDAQILAMLPTVTTSYYSNEKLAQANAVLTQICEYYGVAYVDLRYCGITTADLPDGIHPDAAGMDCITDAVLETLFANCDMTAGENVVYSVSHDLTGVTASLGYYKGISAGKSFVETLTADNAITVTVTMGGNDITESSYADGRISIETVTGNIVITAEAKFSLENRLQQLPDPYYSVNLWPILEHDADYYSVNGWEEHSSGKVRSVTIPVVPGEKLYASSFAAASENGSSTNGIRITFFSEYGLLISMSAPEVYAEFTQNGYIIVPQNAVAVNIPMWTDDEGWELYIWESSYVSIFDLGAHLQQLPENICAGTNLWTALEPQNDYYTGTQWGNLTTGQVWSVTIPVSAGDQIYANSFEEYGMNGNTFNTTNSIRVTYFGENGILKSVAPGEVYTEFDQAGFLTVPEGATAMNIPMWNGDEDNVLYILNREHTYVNDICTACGEENPNLDKFAGKTISILGASISTYTGISNDSSTNSTIGSNAVYYTEGRYGVYADDTWWMQVCTDLGFRLLVNNSWSGSSLLHTRNGTVGAYVDRCVQLHDDTGDNNGEEPDIIGIQLGTNDYQYYKSTLGTADIDYGALIIDNSDGTYTYSTPTTSLEAAAIVLHKISVRYPNAEVYYLTLSQRVDFADGEQELLEQFNADLAAVCAHFGVSVVDIYNCGIDQENFDTYIGDGRVHPNCLGMDAYTEAFKRAVLANHKQETAYTVDFQLDNAKADYGVDKLVLEGNSFSCTLIADDGFDLSVTVTMGEQDITSYAYTKGVVTIDAVTADVVITATGTEHEAQNYRWEFDGTDLVSVGETENTLTKNAGTTTDGVFSNTRYALDKTVVLRHDQPWSVEWKSEGTWKNSGSASGGRLFTSTDVNAERNARYIFKSVNSYLIAMGEKTTSGSHNYGIALEDYGIDGSEEHTYRLENRINNDGSNMVYLYVDGEEIGPMNNYYIGTASQNTTSDWLSGKDFSFQYIGTDTHGLTNCAIEYVQIWEGGEPLTPLYQEIAISPGLLNSGTCEVTESEIYGYVVNYQLKKGHILSISNTDYVFSVRRLVDGNYSTLLKSATTDSFTATEDMTVAMLIRKPDKSAVTAEELDSIVIYDSLYGMIGVGGYGQGFTVEAETIDGSTATTRAAIFLPEKYSPVGEPVDLIMLTHGYSGYLTDSVWYGNSRDNSNLIDAYLSAGYAVFVVDNTAASTSKTPDLGCPQLISSYLKAYEYVQAHFNVNERFCIHSRSFGTFASMRIMQEVPELVICALMTGPRVSMQWAYNRVDQAFVAERFGFEDTTGSTYEADKMVGYDPYTDVAGEDYDLPPTFWLMCKGDVTEDPVTLISKLIEHGNDVVYKTYTGTDHNGICSLNTAQALSDALAYLNGELELDETWEVGTITAKNGADSTNSSRLRTVDYLKLSDYSGVTVEHGYTITYFAYASDLSYLGNGSSTFTANWLGSGAGITSEEIMENYPDAVYFRLAMRRVDSAAVTLDTVAESGIIFYAAGEEIPIRENDLVQETVMNISGGQDGTVYDGKAFIMNAAGGCTVYDLTSKTTLANFSLDGLDMLKPHANSVCFSDTFYAQGDQYPLLYVNIYNSYSSADDRMEGTCCVYRIIESDGVFTSELVQVIRIGFTEDLELWKSKEDNGDVRPYGNFVVDTDNDKLYAFVMRDAESQTRFFCFDLPALTAGEYSESYGCNVVTLESTDIENMFDVEYFSYLQGCCYEDGRIYSLEGFASGSSSEPILRVINLSLQTVEQVFYLSGTGVTQEPEMIAVDPDDGTVYFAATDGVLRILTIPTPLSDFEYALDESIMTVTLNKYIGNDASVIVADHYTVNGIRYAVVLNSNSVFCGNTGITAVTIRADVTFKDQSMSHLFSQCTKLVSVDMTGVDTSDITDMGYLFDWCSSLSSIIGYEDWETGSVENIYKMFNRVTKLTTIDLSGWDLSNVINTGWCFQLCGASQILLPDNLKTMSAGFLNHATNYAGTTFTVPSGVEKIGYAHTIYDFATNDFVEFIVAEGNTNYVALDGILYSADGTEMLAIPRNKTFENGVYEIPEGVTFLGELSFSRNYNISTVILPDSLEIGFVDLYDESYIVYEDVGNLNAGNNLSIAIYCYTGITDYAVKDTNPNYTSVDGIIYSKDLTTVVAVPSRYNKHMAIPEGVTQWISEAMWADNSTTVDNLMKNSTGVSIPATLVDIAQDQIDKLNRLNAAFATFEIVVSTDNPVYCVDESGNLILHSFTSYISDDNATTATDGTKTAHCDNENCNATHTVVDEGSRLVPDTITSDYYTISEGSIQYVMPNTTVRQLLAALNEGEYIRVFDGEIELSGNDRVTGTMVLKLMDADIVKDNLTVQLMGDVNGDGFITASDGMLVLFAINDKYEMTEEEFARADMDGDGTLTACDALMIMQFAADMDVPADSAV